LKSAEDNFRREEEGKKISGFLQRKKKNNQAQLEKQPSPYWKGEKGNASSSNRGKKKEIPEIERERRSTNPE